VANIVMLGVLTAETRLVGRDAMESAIADRYPKEAELNRKAFAQGYKLFSQGDPP
jgi:Pyruvate/2-oxoacid:ferredoxin oxidoreductase gamma subunit